MALQFSNKGPAVAEVQRLLNSFFTFDASKPDLAVNSSFDNATLARVKEFQSFQSFVSDGVVGDLTLGMLRGDAQMAQVRPMPPVHTQNVSQWTCWAESLVSFLAATGDSMSFTPEEWVGVMAGRNLTGTNNGLTPQGWGAVAADLHLQARLYTDTTGPLHSSAISRDKFGADTLLSLVSTYGYLMVVYNISSTLAHTVVVSGVMLQPGVSDSHRIVTMDPWRVGSTVYPFDHFASSRVIGVIFKPKGSYPAKIAHSGPMEVPPPAQD